MDDHDHLLDVTDLTVEFTGHGGHRVRAVDGASFHLGVGETLGLVGESGSGKSTIGNAILGLAPVGPDSRVTFAGEDITHASSRRRRELGSEIQVVFQDPYSSLNPSRTIGHTLGESLRVGRRHSASEVREIVSLALAKVDLPPEAAARYPRQFSGGQRQRIAIARALVQGPRLIICDEPTSALDLSVQAQILNLLVDLQGRDRLSYLFISHDIDVVKYISDRVAVLNKGVVVEAGAVEDVTTRPRNPYTRDLIAAVPVADPRVQARRREERATARRAARNGEVHDDGEVQTRGEVQSNGEVSRPAEAH